MKAGLMLAVNPATEREENDFYATDPWAIYKARDIFHEIGLCKDLWEPACGLGHLSKALTDIGYNVRSSDLINRGFGEQFDILACETPWHGDIITNPPFKLANEFVRKSIDLLSDGHKAVFLLKIQYLETTKRAKLFRDCGLKYVIVNSDRVGCARNADFDSYFTVRDGHYVGGTQFYAWFVFEKGFVGDAMLKFI